MDLSPMQPTDVPSNCEFIIGDLTESLEDFHDNNFDLVHSRYSPDSPTLLSKYTFECVCAKYIFAEYTKNRFIQGGVKANEWQKYVNDAYRILKPGGWAQMGEIACASPMTDNNSLPYDAPMAEVPPVPVPLIPVSRMG